MNKAEWALKHGAEFPYDDDSDKPKPATDWAHAAARGVIADLTGRKGVGNELEEIDAEIRIEVIETLSDIIRTAHEIVGEPS